MDEKERKQVSDYACQLPTNDIAVMKRLIRSARNN